MLIDFTVENFRSIRDPVTLSMVAAPGRKTSAKTSKRPRVKSDDEIAPPFRLESRNLSLLPALGIFGANASGKSNVVRALTQFHLLMYSGINSEVHKLRALAPFGLIDSTREMPMRFRLRVIIDDIFFTYTLSANHIRVLEEVLEYVPSDARNVRQRLLFERIWDRDKGTYSITNGKDFGGSYKKIQESIREDEIFMRLLTSSLDVEVLRPFVSWLRVLQGGFPIGFERMEYEVVARALRTELVPMLEGVTRIVRRFDTGIVKIEVEAESTEKNEDSDGSKVWVVHETGGEQVRWRMEEESTGTQRLFTLALRILISFHTGGLLLIDELGSNIHPNITRAIVRMFQSEKTNPKRAQLIFTSHDNTLQRGNLLRRDQIWFTQKRADGSTELYPLSDFSPRNDLAIDKAYLEGRFGAVPILPGEEELLEPAEAK